MNKSTLIMVEENLETQICVVLSDINKLKEQNKSLVSKETIENLDFQIDEASLKVKLNINKKAKSKELESMITDNVRLLKEIKGIKIWFRVKIKNSLNALV